MVAFLRLILRAHEVRVSKDGAAPGGLWFETVASRPPHHEAD